MPAGRIASGGPPAQGGSGGPPPEWRGRAELPGGAVVEGVFCGLRPHGPATLAEGGVTYAAEYDGARTIAEGPVPKEVCRAAAVARALQPPDKVFNFIKFSIQTAITRQL